MDDEKRVCSFILQKWQIQIKIAKISGLKKKAKMTTVPTTLLLRYFEIAQRRLQNLTDDLGGEAELPSDPNLSWHRTRIVEAQLASLDDAISSSPIDREAIQSVLRQIGKGDFSSVSFDNVDITSPSAASSSSSTGLRSRSSTRDGGEPSELGVLKDNSQEQKLLITEAVEQTNELARQAFARSVLIVEWRLDLQPLSQCGREIRENVSLDRGSILEYCGLMMAAVGLPEVHQYLQTGVAELIHPNRKDGNHSDDSSAEDRLLHIQKLYWRALGWESSHAMDQLNSTLTGKSAESNTFDQKVMETLSKYASVMTNVGMSIVDEDTQCDDGTTRVVSVSYSEHIINVDSSGNESQSLSAPASKTIDEHEASQQRQEMDVAQKTAMLQQEIWSEFESLPPKEKSEMLEMAKMAHQEFVQKIANTPPGNDRILLMQSIDGETQKLLVIFKLACSHSFADAE